MRKKNFELILEFFFVFLLIFSPLFFAGVATVPFITIQLILFSMACLFIFYTLITGRKFIFPAPLYLLGFFAAIIIFQIIPLPVYLVRVISPKTFLLHKQYAEFIQSPLCSLSLYDFSTQQALAHFISLVIVFIVTINIFNSKRQFERLILTIIFLALGLSLYGVARKYFILGQETTATFSTFGNRNHFAAYTVMAVSLTAGYALSRQDKFQKFIFSFAGAIMAASVFLSLSRAGTFSLLFSFTLMFFLLKKEQLIERNYWVIAIPVILGIFFLSAAGFEPLRNRLSLLWEGLGSRAGIFRDALQIIKDFPFFGAGYGNFAYVFTSYQTKAQSAYYTYLHNDHLQLIVETGLIGASLYFIFLFAILKDILVQLKQRHDTFAKTIVIGGLCGLSGVIAHSFLDFNFHIPAVSLLFWFILGLIYKCAYVRFYRAP